MQKFQAIGRLTKDVEVKITPNGKTVAGFTIAVRRDYKNAEGKYDSDFFNCQAWGKTGETIGNYVTKGQRLYVEGKLQNRSWDKDGQKHYITEVIVNIFEFIEKREKGMESFGSQIFDEQVDPIPF